MCSLSVREVSIVERPVRSLDAGDSLRVLAVVDGKELSRLVFDHRRVAEIVVEKVVAEDELPAPGAPRVLAHRGPDAERRLATPVHEHEPAVGKRDAVRG